MKSNYDVIVVGRGLAQASASGVWVARDMIKKLSSTKVLEPVGV